MAYSQNMEEKPLLSVIVPAYNTEKYIEKCLRSICTQIYQNLEIIVVDDGSVDQTGRICDEMAGRDHRIQVIHKMNSGSVAARKEGVRAANGLFITFVDSDDWIEPDMYACLMKQMVQDNTDLITSNMYYENEITYQTSTIEDTLYAEGLYQKEAIRSVIYPKLIYDELKLISSIGPSLCNKIFKTELLRPVIEKVDENIVLGDDAVVTYAYIFDIQSMKITYGCWYHYLVHKGSTVRSRGIDEFAHVLSFQRNMREMVGQRELLPFFQGQIDGYVNSLLSVIIKNVYGINILERRYLFPFDKLPKESRIVIYGAGKVGKSYWKCLQSCNYARKLYWVDKKYAKLQKMGIPVESPRILSQIEFDYIVIAVSDEKIAEEIKADLKNIKHTADSKIVWSKPNVI